MRGNFNAMISGNKPVLVDFHAQWCQPCKIQSPILQDVARELAGKVKIIKIDVDKNMAIARKYQVQGVPTLALFKNGKLTWRKSGVQSKQQIMQIIQANL